MGVNLEPVLWCVFDQSPVVLVVSDCCGLFSPWGVSRVGKRPVARLQEAALELSLPVARIGGLAVSRREAAGGGALSGVVNCLTAQVVA